MDAAERPRQATAVATGSRPVVVLVPAYNEEEQIADAIESVQAQTIPVRIVVCADNCTDRTVDIAESYPEVTVFETVGNAAKKGGALNQGWDRYGRDADFVFTMDADTVLAPDCLERMLEKIDDRGAVCAWPALKPPTSERPFDRVMHRLTRLDYGGFGRSVRARRYATEVLSGIGTLFHGSVLREVATDQGGLPWATDSLVEDYRISLEIRRLGYDIAVAPKAIASTDAVVDMKGLWRQRTRWASGTWQELIRFGWKPYTRRVWLSASLCLGNLLLRLTAFSLLLFVLLFCRGFHYNFLWLIPVGVSVVEQIDVLRNTPNTDRKDILLALSIVPVEAYRLLRESWTVWSLGRALRRRSVAW
jgi:cellulose synthase/poly-beta-1,6-N-acetylglucosamine synthase-like glycosyltransferase